MLIGEAPGRREDEQGEPFVGASRSLLEHWWEPLGIRSSMVYWTNVYPYRPPNNKIVAISRRDIEFWSERLHERLAALQDPFVIVPTGNIALRALFGDEGMRISDWRGSILDYKGKKVIPTFHPAATFRQAVLTRFCKADWKRISEDMTFRELRLPEIDVLVEPSEEEFAAYYQTLSGVMAFDIENDKTTGELLCLGFSMDGKKAMALPLSKRAQSNATWLRMMHYARALCEHPVSKVGQNAQHDQYILRKNGIDVASYDWDLMEMDHAFDPNDGGDTQSGSEGAPDSDTIRISMRSLAVLASIHTRFPYYKKGGRKSVKEFNWGRLYDYNGMDACVTRVIWPVLFNRLVSAGLVDVGSYSSLLPSAVSPAPSCGNTLNMDAPSLCGP